MWTGYHAAMSHPPPAPWWLLPNRAALDAPLDVPVHTTLQARVPIHGDVQG